MYKHGKDLKKDGSNLKEWGKCGKSGGMVLTLGESYDIIGGWVGGLLNV